MDFRQDSRPSEFLVLARIFINSGTAARRHRVRPATRKSNADGLRTCEKSTCALRKH